MSVRGWTASTKAVAVAVVMALAGSAFAARVEAAAQGAKVPPAKAAQAKPAAAAARPAVTTKLPATVEAAFRKAYPFAKIRNVSHETENGQEQYEIESLDSGLRLDVNFRPDGALLVEEREVAAADVPAAVTAAIAARYPKATQVLREKVTEGASVLYEIGLKGAPVKAVQLTPEGKWVSPKAAK